MSLLQNLTNALKNQSSETTLLDFFIYDNPNWNGDTYLEIMSYSHAKLESKHNYIQWLFPTSKESQYTKSPVVTTKNITEYQKSIKWQERYLQGFFRMMKFYGFSCSIFGEDCYVYRDETFSKRSKVWLTKNNHNYKRLTRIMDSLIIFQKKELAYALYQTLLCVGRQYPSRISEETLMIWKELFGETM